MILQYGTYSKSPAAWGFQEKLFVLEAQGARVRLSDGKDYLDFVSGLGTNLLGYNDPGVAQAVMKMGGLAPSLPHFLEYRVAEQLIVLLGRRIPGWHSDKLMVRFAKTGTDVTTMAIRLARAITGRALILSCGYHGWADWSIAKTHPALGIPPSARHQIRALPFNDTTLFPSLGAAESKPAAVIIEQPLEGPVQGFYPAIRRFCNETGALLIMDEIVTGLRYGLGGACELYDIEPDLICLGKGLGNGFPISALVGRQDYMSWFTKTSPVFCSSTYWGETAGLAAATAVLKRLQETGVEYLWGIGQGIIEGLQDAGWGVIGHSPRSLLQFDDEYQRAFFIHGMRERGFLVNRPNFPCMVHTGDDVKRMAAAAREVRKKMDKSGPEAVRKQVREKLPRVLFRAR